MSLRNVGLAPEDKEAVFNTLKGYAASRPVAEKRGTLTETLDLIKASLGIRFRF